MIAREREIFSCVAATVFDRNYVFDVEARKRDVKLRDSAILATIARTAANECSHSLVDHCGASRENCLRAFACKMAMMSLART